MLKVVVGLRELGRRYIATFQASKIKLCHNHTTVFKAAQKSILGDRGDCVRDFQQVNVLLGLVSDTMLEKDLEERMKM